MLESDGYVYGEGEEGPPGEQDAFVWDADTGELEKLTWNTAGAEANNGTTEVSLSRGAGAAAIMSYAWDLVPGDVDDEIDDIFVGTPCMAVPEPSPALLRAAMLVALAGLARLRSSRASRAPNVSLSILSASRRA